jgi:hypothetical protein
MKQKLPLLVTSAIRVSAPLTQLVDPQERLAATLHALKQWTENAAVESIVVTDGSGFDYSTQVQALARSSGKEIEFLCCQNNEALTSAKGKGYGEGEIVLHALTHSRILVTSKFFAKCTGKLYVRNYHRCLAAFDNEFQCAVHGKRGIEALDTRLYFASREFWLRHLSDAHLRVDDSTGYFLEHSYLDRFREIKLRGFTLPIPPIVVGRSGSGNVEYAPMGFYHYLSRRLRFSIFRRIY